jgi:hypothetical protein
MNATSIPSTTTTTTTVTETPAPAPSTTESTPMTTGGSSMTSGSMSSSATQLPRSSYRRYPASAERPSAAPDAIQLPVPPPLLSVTPAPMPATRVMGKIGFPKQPTMRARVKTTVTIYIAPDVLASLIPQSERGAKIQTAPIRVSELMSVELRSPDGAFTIEQDSHPDKIVLDPDATRPTPWTFAVTPMRSGDHDLVAEICSLRPINGQPQPLIIDSETQTVHVKVNVIGNLLAAWPYLSPFAVVIVGAYPFFKRRKRKSERRSSEPDPAAWVRPSPNDRAH